MMRAATRRFFTISLLSLATICPFGAAHGARISKGDVEAVFNAFLSGGRANVFRTIPSVSPIPGQFAAPADNFGSKGAIRPIPGQPWDGGHFCKDDWHVILLGVFDGGDTSFTKQDATQTIGRYQLTFTLDGAELQTRRTAIKRFLHPEVYGADEIYGYQQGKIMSPSDIPVGEHTLDVSADIPGHGVYSQGIVFYIDPSGSSACD